jgi:uncharacterized membrane protein
MDKTRLAIALVFFAAIGSGIVAGTFFAFSSFVMAALGRIPPVQGVAAMKSINVSVINPTFMSAFVGTGLLCLVLGAASLFRWNQGGAKLVLVASLVYLVGSFGITMIFNVPLNNKLASIADTAQAVAFWPNYLAAWTIWNHVRTVAAALSAVLFTGVLCRSVQ